MAAPAKAGSVKRAPQSRGGAPAREEAAVRSLTARLARACEEVSRYIREGWGGSLHEEGRCRWEEGGRAVLVELLLFAPSAEATLNLVDFVFSQLGRRAEDIRRILERHGIAVERFGIDVRVGGSVAEVAIRFRVAPPS
jgi:hypothetical protein